MLAGHRQTMERLQDVKPAPVVKVAPRMKALGKMSLRSRLTGNTGRTDSGVVAVVISAIQVVELSL